MKQNHVQSRSLVNLKKKYGLSRSWTFSFPDPELLTLLKIEMKKKTSNKKFKILVINFDTKLVSKYLIL